MNCYFYSNKKSFIGILNYRLIKNSLYWDKNKLIEDIRIKGEKTGYIYSCRQKEGNFFNNGYKTPNPIEVIACEKLEDLL